MNPVLWVRHIRLCSDVHLKSAAVKSRLPFIHNIKICLLSVLTEGSQSLPVFSGKCVQEDIHLGGCSSCFKHRARLKSTSPYLPRTHGDAEATSPRVLNKEDGEDGNVTELCNQTCCNCRSTFHYLVSRKLKSHRVVRWFNSSSAAWH